MLPAVFQFEKVSNGGWLVTAPGRDYKVTVLIAAFSNTNDLLEWLTKELPNVPAPKRFFDEPAVLS